MYILYEKLLKAYQNKGKVHQMSGKCERAAKKEIQWEFHWKIDDKYIRMVNKLEILNLILDCIEFLKVIELFYVLKWDKV